ncbi:MAG: MGMT family protein, partial [gamma proteobacterium symbiont of Lucinoma myriamae]|nr:MGMT family protein [gamma proteobacterium symbiont of Lucinoma myriamae]MCU7818359.1 MGMT family protein [gamma proteobacterium symbiont of Lucinoma myriamae]
ITVSEPPIADPHDGWCGGCRRETCGYPILSIVFSKFMTTIVFPLPIAEQLYLSVSFVNNTITGTHYLSNGQPTPSSGSPSTTADSVFAKQIKHELESYFKTDSQFTLTCDLQSGTEFQRKVWQALLEIPSGEVKTYGALAKELNSSARAVGNACRQNLFPVIVPCHRVVSASGIGGYAGDTLDKQHGRINFLQIKQWLLAHEKAHIK